MIKNICITGGEGFIGRHLIERLPKEYLPYIYDLKPISKTDISEKKRNEEFMFPANIYAVIHLAAIHDIRFANEHPQETFEANVWGTYNVLNEARKRNARKFIFISSAAIYEQPLISIYGLSKFLGEKMVENSGLDYSILRLFNVYGPRQRKALFGNLIKCIEEGQPWSYTNTGKGIKDFGYIGKSIQIFGD